MSRLLGMYEQYDRYEMPEYRGGERKVLSCDLAVVGGGGSGLSAAVRAAELGAKPLIIEKTKQLGGNSFLAGGLLSTTSKYQRALGFEDQTDHYLETALKFNRYLLDPRLYSRYIRNSGRYLEWLVDHGLDIDNSRWVMDGSVLLLKEPVMESPLHNPAYGPGWTGTAVVNILEEQVIRRQIPVLMETKVRSLMTDGSGAVTGVYADGQDVCYEIHAKAVLISAGNCAGNPELLRRLLPKYFTSDSYFSHYSLSCMTGDGILMAEEAGAETGKNMSVSIHPLGHYPGTYTVQRLISEPIGIVVNRDGRRFCCEDDADNAELVVDRQPEGLGYYVVDAATLEEGFSLAVEHVRFGDRVPTHEEFEQNLKDEIRQGKIGRADSLEELSRFIGCAPAALQATVDRCNGHFRKGKDDEFYKAPENLREIGTPPFYAVRLQRNFDVTMGGISIDYRFRALRPDQTVIPGLYAAGDNASNWMGEEYGPMFSSFCWAVNSGFLVGEQTAEELRG